MILIIIGCNFGFKGLPAQVQQGYCGKKMTILTDGSSLKRNHRS